MVMNENVSTTALAESRQIDPKDLFNTLHEAGYVVRHENRWHLTYLGEKFGGQIVNHKKFGSFIVWPSHLVIDDTYLNVPRLSVTQIGEQLKLAGKKVNLLLSELGWIRKHDQGWQLTPNGIKAGGEQRTDKNSQTLYVSWHRAILHNKRFKQSVVEFLGQDAKLNTTDKSFSSFKFQFESKHRTLDGHFVRSRSELIIDNWLYMANVVHAYARLLPLEEDQICDFYLPQGKVYLQYWGDDEGEYSTEKIEQTRKIYEGNGFELIELYADDIQKLDSILPNKLRPYGIKAY